MQEPKLSDITIKIQDSNKLHPRDVVIEAFVYPDIALAVHKSWKSKDAPDAAYSITHIPTGLNFLRAPSEEALKDALSYLNELLVPFPAFRKYLSTEIPANLIDNPAITLLHSYMDAEIAVSTVPTLLKADKQRLIRSAHKAEKAFLKVLKSSFS